MTACPKCNAELIELDDDIVFETQEMHIVGGGENIRAYECPHCGAFLQVHIKVEKVEVRKFARRRT